MPMTPDIQRHPALPDQTIGSVPSQAHSLPWIALWDLRWAGAATACYHKSHHICSNYREHEHGAAYSRVDVWGYFTYDFYHPRHPMQPREVHIAYRRMLHMDFYGRFVRHVGGLFHVMRVWHSIDMNWESDVTKNRERRDYLEYGMTTPAAERQASIEQQDRLPFIPSQHLEICLNMAVGSRAMNSEFIRGCIFSGPCDGSKSRIQITEMWETLPNEFRMRNAYSVVTVDNDVVDLAFNAESMADAFQVLRESIRFVVR